MLIRFSPMRTTASVLPTAIIKPFIGRRSGFGANSEQRAKGVEGIEPAVKPERELVEVGLKVLRRDAVMTALKPAFEVAENQVDDGQKFLGDFRVSSFDHGEMFVS